MIRISLVLLLFCCLMACNNPKKKDVVDLPANQEVEVEHKVKFAWLEGTWMRTNEEEGKETFEIWKRNADGNYSGLAYTLEVKDTIFREDLLFALNAKGDWYLSVLGEGEEAPTIFNLTEESASSFTVENPEMEFPTHIGYYMEGDHLMAFVKNDEFSINFDYERLK